jgi:hypothetical protein
MIFLRRDALPQARPISYLLTVKSKALYALACVVGVLLSSPLSAADFILNAESSHISYRIHKYGTMLVEGHLAADKKHVLSGQLSLKDFESFTDLDGQLIISKAEFRSGHARRDDEVSALFRTPIKLHISGGASCELDRRQCLVGVQLVMNDKSNTYSVPVTVFREFGLVHVQGTLDLVRQDYDLVFRAGFPATLDAAVADELHIDFDLAFDGDEANKGRFALASGITSDMALGNTSDNTSEGTPSAYKAQPWWQGWINRLRAKFID